MKQWDGFLGEKWKKQINVNDFILQNVKSYDGDESFLSAPSARTQKLMEIVNGLLREEQERGGVLDIDTGVVSSLNNYAPGYIEKGLEIIYGLQTDKPLKRGVNPFGGIRMARSACEAYGYKLSDEVEKNFEYRTTHNDGVFRVYTDEMKAVRHAGIITGLPDAYGRGRIIGDYRRVALYGVDRLIEEKQRDKAELMKRGVNADSIQLSEELYRQISFLNKLKIMAESYGFDISLPADTARKAVQWVYFAYLAAIKEQNGAAMSFGRVSTFLDIFIERDIERLILTEKEAQELVDQLVIKLRLSRQLRTEDYNELFAGDPTWTTESIGGMAEDGRSLVTKSSFRFLHTLHNLGPAPEPNMTVLWSEKLPRTFKEYCAKMSIETDAIQYENDDIMRPIYGDDYAIACCVSAMKVGKQMQFFGARCNLAKLLLLAINGGKDEITGKQIAPVSLPMKCDKLDFEEVKERFDFYMKWLAKLYIETLNVIHFMHDKYAYEKIQMALHDTNVHRFMACGVAGLSVVADSLSSIKFANVKPIFGENDVVCDFEVHGSYPMFGNDDDRVDSIAQEILKEFSAELKAVPTYRGSEATLSVLTITSNVVYGKKTGSTPDGRKKGEPFAPGANPMHGREHSGALASLNSLAKLPYECCRDGISNTFSIVPNTIGKTEDERKKNLVAILDGYFIQNAHHINVNVLDREKLEDAMKNPHKYPNLTIRISGYAVHFNKLSENQQREVLKRTFFDTL